MLVIDFGTATTYDFVDASGAFMGGITAPGIRISAKALWEDAAKLPEIVQRLPLERILVETDCPYMAPVPMRGKRNEPAYVHHVAAKLAELRQVSFEKVALQTTSNAQELYGRL